MAEIDISGIFPLDLLAAFYNNALCTDPNDDYQNKPMSETMAANVWKASLQSGISMFESINGKLLYIDLSGPTLDTSYFDEVNGGPGAAERIVAQLREGMRPFAGIPQAEEMVGQSLLDSADLVYRASDDDDEDEDDLEAEAAAMERREKIEELREAMGGRVSEVVQIRLSFELG